MPNPTLQEGVLKNDSFHTLNGEHAMTINGTILKTCVLGLMAMATFSYTWYLILTGFADKAIMLAKFGMWGALALIFLICFAPKNKFLIFAFVLLLLPVFIDEINLLLNQLPFQLQLLLTYTVLKQKTTSLKHRAKAK